MEEYEQFTIQNQHKLDTGEFLVQSLDIDGSDDERGAVLDLVVGETGENASTAIIRLCPGQWTMLKAVGDAILKAQMVRAEAQAEKESRQRQVAAADPRPDTVAPMKRPRKPFD